MKTIPIVAIIGAALLLGACTTTTGNTEPQRCYRTTNSGKVPYRVPVPCKRDHQSAAPQSSRSVGEVS